MRSVPALFAVAAIAAPFALGCTSHSEGTGDAQQATGGDAGADAVITCENDSRVKPYTANMTAASSSGALTVTLVAGDPAPPAKGSNTWTIRLTDASNHPIVGASVTVALFMPDHGHGTSIVPVITAKDDGTYGIAPLYLFMPGVWRITIGLAGDAGTAADQAAFFFCVAG